MKTFKVPFAFDEYRNIVDIHSAVKGKAYYCNCGSEVKLRGGDVVSDHFYHTSEVQCSLESAIHKAYKSVFYSLKKIKLPYPVNNTDVLVFDKVELEKQINDYRPDAIGYIGEEKYLIEFAKTSFIDKRKEQKIKRSNLFCIEIEIDETVISIADITDHLINQKYFKRNIHIPEYKGIVELRSKFTVAYNKIKNKLEETKRLLLNKTSELDNLKEELNNLYFLKKRLNETEILLNDKTKELDYISNELKNLFLFYTADSRTGVKLYKKYLGDGKEIIASQSDKVLNIKFNL